MSSTSIQDFRVTLRDFLISQVSITNLVSERVLYHDWYSLHESQQVFPSITIAIDTGRSYLGLSSTFDIFINGHSDNTFFEAHEVLQAVTDILDPLTSYLNSSFSLRGFSNPTEEYDPRSRVYTARKKFRVNIIGV
jgi:hypothetical protein